MKITMPNVGDIIDVPKGVYYPRTIFYIKKRTERVETKDNLIMYCYTFISSCDGQIIEWDVLEGEMVYNITVKKWKVYSKK